MTAFALTDRPAHDTAADVAVFFAHRDGDSPVVHAAPEGDALGAALRAIRYRGKDGETAWLPAVAGVAAGTVLVVGLAQQGDGDDDATPEGVRRAAGVAGRALAGRSTAVVALPAGDDAILAAAVEGLRLGAYAFTDFRGEKAKETLADRAPVDSVLLAGAGGSGAGDALAAAVALADRVAFARDLVNTPANVLYPESFAALVEEAAPEGVTVTTYDVARLEQEGCGGLLGVGQGSSRGPRLVHLDYAPHGASAHLAYVGKGITFDSGGLCIKTAAGMTTMKCDMGGAAAVVGAVFALAERSAPVRVEGWLCLAENMPGPDAQRPGDVVTMADGTTCEIINTDAEGRLVLADGLALASRSTPDAIVDVATLTGACVVALGHRTAAVLANDGEFQAEVATAATEAGEGVWPMPIPEEIPESLTSEVADRKHAGPREGGALLAAAFLREYVGDATDGEPISWAHLDIAGPAWNDGSAYGYTPKGGTGFGVRTLVHLAESRS